MVDHESVVLVEEEEETDLAGAYLFKHFVYCYEVL